MSTNETRNVTEGLLSRLVPPALSNDQQPVKADNVVVGIDKARKRRQKAQEKTDALGNALAKLQSQYVVCAEPAGYWDMNEGRLIKEQGFRLRYSTPKFKPPGGEKLKSIADIFRGHPDTTRCSYLTFRPGKPAVDGDYLNLWTPMQIKEIEGDVKPFLEHLDYIYDGVQESIDFTLNWMALPLQQLGTKMESAILLVGEPGTGKTIVGAVLRKLHGFKNTDKINGEELESQFNDYMMRSTIVTVEEVCLKGKWTLMDRIKDTITSTKTRVNLKHISPYEIENVTNFILFSNHSNALAINERDRRWHVHVSHQPPKENDYYDKLSDWLTKENGYGIIYHYLMHRDLSNFSRYSKPPMTQCKKDMAFSSKSLVEQKITDDIENRNGLFVCDLVTLDQVIQRYAKNGIAIDKSKENAVIHAMHNLGASISKPVRLKLKRQVLNPMGLTAEVEDARWRLWSVRDHEKWKNATAEEKRAELKKAHPDLLLKDD